MNFDHGLYMFSEVSGFDSSKGEPGISKAFHKLWLKSKQLEQARMLEKNNKEIQTTEVAGVTFLDLQYELLLTQLRFIIQCVKDYGGLTTSIDTSAKDSSRHLTATVFNPSGIASLAESKKIDIGDLQLNNEASNDETCSSKTNHHPNLLPESSKSNVPMHYHLKLNDVPFILGTSSSASHSVVANVQNIIAMMKCHNKALCAPKVKCYPITSTSVSEVKTTNQNSNQMIQELSYDLKKLSMKHKELEKRFDSPQTHQNLKNKTAEIPVDQTKNTTENNQILKSSSMKCIEKTVPDKPKLFTQLKNSRSKKNVLISGIPSVNDHRITVNKNPNLARAKILRSLQDFKSKLSEEDLSWE